MRHTRKLAIVVLSAALMSPSLPLLAKDNTQKDAGPKLSEAAKERGKAFLKAQREKHKKFREEMKAKRKAFKEENKKERDAFIAANPDLKQFIERRAKKMRRRMRGKKGLGGKNKMRDRKADAPKEEPASEADLDD